MKKMFLIICMLISLSSNSAFAKKCTGKFVNPITDIEWSCMFPITIRSIEIVGSDLADTKNPSSPICLCPKFGVPTPGIVGGYWEPSRMVDVSQEPYCFVNLGGLEIDLGFERSQGGRPKGESSKISTWYAHYYIYPILSMLEIFTDFICLQETNFDPLWITELDPSGNDDELAMILHPESFLYNNIVAQAACAADCASSSTQGKPIDMLHWCAGCQGSMYPMNSNVNAHIGGVQASLNVAEKITYKMHRQGMSHQTSSDNIKEICTKKLAPMIKKSHYRYQLVNPDVGSCAPFGKTTNVFEANKETPIVGEDFGYLIWRKKSCCIF